MTDLKTADQVRNLINKSYKRSVKAEGSNGARRVNAQVADYLRDAALLGPQGVVQYPNWRTKGTDLTAGIEASDYSDYEHLGTEYDGPSRGAFHTDETIFASLKERDA